jgi:hypothetical protein
MWEVWIVPIIAIAVWILGSLMKGTEPERAPDRSGRPGGPRPQPGEPGAPRPRAPGDLDKFLQEIQRRRRAAEERERPPQPEPQPQAERPPERTIDRPPLSAQPGPRPRPPQPRPAQPAPAPRRRPVRSVPDQPTSPPVARPVSEPRRPRVPAREVPVEPPLDVLPVPPRLQPPLTPAPAPAPPVAVVVAEVAPPPEPTFPQAAQARRQSPALEQLVAFLKSPQSMRAAIVLQEVLGPPVCRRRRNGGR